MSPRAAHHKQLLDAAKARLEVTAAPPRGKVNAEKSLGKFIARECGVRVAQDVAVVSDSRVKTYDHYDFKEREKSRIYDAANNPLGDVEPFDAAYPRIMDNLRDAAKRREAEANKGRK